MCIRFLDKINKKILVSIPLTRHRSKTRIKKRSILNEYGIPVSTKQEKFSQQCYVEWQIGYDVGIDDQNKLGKTTLKTIKFIGADGKEKALYELSEYIYYFYKWNIISKDRLETIRSFLQGIDKTKFLNINNEYVIDRSNPIEKELFGIKFEYTQVKYPLLIHKFMPFEIVTEIKITEKQYAIGIQPMLYFCFPITELKSDIALLDRTTETKETADFIIDKNNINVFLEILKIFGILSQDHNKDILSIIDIIFKK